MPVPPRPSPQKPVTLEHQGSAAPRDQGGPFHTRKLGSNSKWSFDPNAVSAAASPSGTPPAAPPPAAPPPAAPPPALPQMTDPRASLVSPAEVRRPLSSAPDARPPIASAPEPAAGVPAPGSAPAPETVYLPGIVIAGKYRLTRVIGHGGMGSVWRARNIPLDIDVAIKLIRRDKTAPEAAGRLLQEARAAARIKHPSIVRVNDFGESEQGDPFIVMELLQGESLRAILMRKGCISPNTAVQTLLPVASALVAAHMKGIVHRDLKPDNILLVTDEAGALVPKVVDFGIAKALHKDFDGERTLAGEVLGSPEYMSPEQAQGAERVGEPTDIWAFSVVLYESMTGRRPFTGMSYNSLVASILGDEPIAATDLSKCDAALWAIIRRGLEKNAAARWPSIREMGVALATWALERGIEDDVTGSSIHKAWLSGAAKRLFTVYPETQSAPALGIRPAAGAPVEAPQPAVNGAPMPAPAFMPPQADTLLVDTGRHPQFRPNRKPLIVVFALAFVGLALIVGYASFSSSEDEDASSSAETAAPSAEAMLSAALPPAKPSAEPSASPSATQAAAEPSASSLAAPSASAKTTTPLKPRKNKVAPPAPKSIRF